MTKTSRITKKLKKWGSVLLDTVLVLVDFLTFVYIGALEWVERTTRPFMRKLFSRCPLPPIISVKDVRANRIRIKIVSTFSSAFNVETFDVQWSPQDINDWHSVGANELSERTVARLKGDTEYQFRVQAINERGCSKWTEPLSARSKIDPIDGGGHGPGYTWTQNATEVAVAFELPASTSKRDVSLTLGSETLRVAVAGTVLLEGKLSGSVRGFDGGSLWEMVKEYGKMVMTVTLEKSHKSVAPKFDYWRAVVVGDLSVHREIDTHKIASESSGPQMFNTSQVDPQQLRDRGLS